MGEREVKSEPAVNQPNDEKVNILLVDDHVENLVALEAALDLLGQNIVRAYSGHEALRCLLEQDFAVILMDVQMPDMDGFEAARIIRERERSRHTPIVFLTAINKSEAHVSRGYALGAVDYLLKPFHPEILRSKVSAFVEIARKNRELQREIVARQEAEATVRKLNSQLERRVAERTADLQRANRELKQEIAERKRAELELRREQDKIEGLNRRLQRAMTETHHRVKNNLQTIAAIVDMRLMDEEEMIPSGEIEHLGTQIRTLAAVHDILTHEAKVDAQAHSISAAAILEKLIPLLRTTSGDRLIKTNLQDIRLPAKHGSSLALVVNELVSNALKYGEGDVDIGLGINGVKARLTVRDHGKGFPSGFVGTKAANTGLELVESLSKWDLGARVRYENHPQGGGLVSLDIPLPQERVDRAQEDKS